MATVYKGKIKLVSAFCNYDARFIADLIAEFLKNYRNDENGLGFESIFVEIKREE